MSTDADLDRVLRSLLREPAVTPTGGLRRALAEVATTPQHRHRWPRRPGWLGLGATFTRYAIAGIIVVLAGGLLAVSQVTTPASDDPPLLGASAASPGPSSEVACEFDDERAELEPGTYYGAGMFLFDFTVPASGWTFGSKAGPVSIEKGPCVLLSAGWETPSTTITFGRVPDGVYADACSRERLDPFPPKVREVNGPLAKREQRMALAAAVAAIPGVEVIEGPSEVDTLSSGEVEATRVTIAIPACARKPLWHDLDWGDSRQPRDPRARITVWIFDYLGHALMVDQRFWVEAETWRLDMDDEVARIIDSVGACCG